MALQAWHEVIKKMRLIVLFVAALLPCGVFHAMASPALYQAEVNAEQTQQQWQREALQQVLIRVTGQPDIMQRPELRTELNNAASYVKQFEAVRTEQGNNVRVLLDAVRIQQVLRQLQIPIWGGQRPELLFWMVQQQGTERQFVRQADSILLQSLETALQQQGLPYTLPLYDLDDLVNLTENDVWGGFWPQIEQASSRYNVQQVVVLLIEEMISAEPEVVQSWRLTALRQHNGLLLRDELTAPDEQTLMQHYSEILSQQLTQQYAILLTPEVIEQSVLQINGLTQLTDIVQLERRLSELLGVSRVMILSHSAEKTLFALNLQMTAEQLLQSLVFEPNLQLRAQAQSWPTDLPSAVEAQPVLAEFDYIRP
ncbi:DUF2066 domain-containing protein [Alishewanella sp. d11]|uniref:DUF2066 domain-containing protein n=1 Tax=Alishewanella sp. d11 TaxID=3414030 RepID=UPI003BF88177